MRTALLLAVALVAAGCTTTFEGEQPSALYGQRIDAAVALYGRWDEVVHLDGKRNYLWRRKTLIADSEYFCELRLEVTERQQIARRFMQGFPEACALFTARFVPVDRN